MPITTKRIYDDPDPADGLRVLVDRLWPRGLTKEAAAIDLWPKELTPTNELRKWFHEDTSRFDEFRDRYRAELDAARPGADALIEQILAPVREEETVTLVYASRDPQNNHALVLREWLEQHT